MMHSNHRIPAPGPLCSSYQHLLPVLDDLTDTRLAADTRAHLATCAWCRAQRATYERFDAALRREFGPDAMPILSLTTIDEIGLTMPEIGDDSMTLTTDDGTSGDSGHGGLEPPFFSSEPPRRSWRMAKWAASVAAVLIISLLAGMVFLTQGRANRTAAQHPTAAPTATTVHRSQSALSAIGMSSATDGWAMGQVISDNDMTTSTGTALHYVNGQWQPVQTAIVPGVELITMLSPTDGWAVGNGGYHYDGASWQPIDLSESSGTLGTFNAISALSPTNVWIAGQDTQLTAGPLIDHFDGKSWIAQPLPSLPMNMNITGIAMVSATDGWAVGFAQGEPDAQGNALSTAVILRYHNGAWSLAQTLPNHEMMTISMVSATDGWIGGDAQTYTHVAGRTPSVDAVPALWHFTDGQWATAPVPWPAGATNLPLGQIPQITMFSATDGWMAMNTGSAQTVDGSAQVGPYLFRLEHGRWVQIQTPTIQQRRVATLSGASFVSPDEFWGVGNTFWNDLATTVTPLIVHYKAGTWTVVES